MQKDDPAAWQEWEPEQLRSIEIAERVAETNDDPFVRLKLWELLHWQASNGLRVAVKSRARQLLDSIRHNADGRFVLLVTDRYSQEEFDENWDALDSETDDTNAPPFRDRRGFARNIEFARQVTREWVETHSDPVEGFSAFNDWLERIDSTRWWNEMWTRSNALLLQLASDYPGYARAWCEIAPERPDSRATGKCADLLYELRKQDQRDAVTLVQGFLAKDYASLWFCVASSYSWPGWSKEPLPEEWDIVKRLLAFPNSQVKRKAAEVVGTIASMDFPRAVNLVLTTDTGEDSKLADTLFAILDERRGFDFNSLSTNELEILVSKLTNVESVRDYHLSQFLLQVALRNPILVVRLLLERLKRKSAMARDKFASSTGDYAALRNALDQFTGLPQSSFHDAKFKAIPNHPEFKDALRLIRDAVLDEDYSSVGLYEDTLSELFCDFSIHYSSQALEVLNEWIDSGECSRVRAAATLLEYTYLGFYVSHTKFLSNYLKRAIECGKDVFGEVERELLGRAEYGPPRAMTSLRGERSNALFHRATEALEKVQGDPLAVTFFQKLRDRGQEMIRAEMEEMADEEVFYRTL